MLDLFYSKQKAHGNCCTTVKQQTTEANKKKVIECCVNMCKPCEVSSSLE